MSLDDMINKGGRAPGGRPVVRGGRPGASAARSRAAPYSAGSKPRGGRAPGGNRRGTGDDGHMSNSSVQDVANSANPTLKVKGDSKPNTVAGAICNVVREGGVAPCILATGPQAINQAMKAVAIARKYLADEDQPCDVLLTPSFEQDVRSGSNVCFNLVKSEPIDREPTEDDLTAKEKTDIYKLAGAIAGRVRDGGNVAITTKGPIPVLVVVKALATAQEYVAEENITLQYAISIVDLENPEIRDATSTYLHFAVVTA